MNQSIEKRQSDSARLFYYDAPDAFGERINYFKRLEGNYSSGAASPCSTTQAFLSKTLKNGQ